jgi:hypothetical protein
MTRATLEFSLRHNQIWYLTEISVRHKRETILYKIFHAVKVIVSF